MTPEFYLGIIAGLALSCVGIAVLWALSEWHDG